MVMAAVSIESLASGLEMAAITAEREAGEAVSWSQAAGYELKVGGVQVTAANKDDITAAINEKWGPGSASGTITYTPSDRWDEPSRLTLNNACISRGIFFSGFDVYGNKLQIQLIGRNRVTVGNSTYENRVMGAVISLDSFTLSGPGSLEAESGVGAAYDGGLLSLEGSMSAGIYCGGRVTIDGCEVTAIGGGTDRDCYHVSGIKAGRGILINHSTVTAIGGETDSGTSRGLYSEQDDIAVNDSTITATAGRAGTYGSMRITDDEGRFVPQDSIGIHAKSGNIICNGGSITATGSSAVVGSSYGIYAGRTVNVHTGEVRAFSLNGTNESGGIYTGQNFTVCGGRVTAFAQGRAVNCAPDLEDYANPIITADQNAHGEAAVQINGAALSAMYRNYKYLRIEPGYTLSYHPNGGQGSMTDNMLYQEGAAVTLSANSFYPPEDSKIFKGWNTRADGSGDSYASGSILTMPGANLILYAQWETMRGDISYAITASAGAGGRISPMGHIPAAYGESKAFTITPDSGYEIGDVTVDGESMGAVSYYIFENITDDHSITVSFQKKTVPSEHVSGDGQGRRQDDIPVSWPFSDVKENPGHWKYENIKYVWKNRIMNGISGTNLFRPDHSLTRAMFAAVLYRMAGEPQVEFTQKFTDVEPGIWYSDAVIWVNIQGMAEGFGDGSYGINRDITREQIAKMLYLFGKAQGYAVSDRRELDSFTDGKDVSRWAVDYMRWAAAVEMITGKPNDAGGFRLDPRGKATRAECAKMLTMFMERYQ